MNTTKSKYISRIQEKQISEILEVFPAVLIEGAKGTGKSTLGEHLSKSSLYMQDPDNSERYIQTAMLKPSLLLEGEKPKLLAEWQSAPNLWDAVRFASDKSGGMPGQFILTGSAVPFDFSTSSEEKINNQRQPHHTGTGRIERMMLRTMSLSESGESTNEISLRSLFRNPGDIAAFSKMTLEDIAFALVRGGWPSVVNRKPSNPSLYAKGYVNAVINTDASRVDDKIKNPERLRYFMRSYARAIGTSTPLSTIRSDMLSNNENISENEIYDFQNALKRIFVVEDLPSWNTKLRSKTAIRTSETRHFSDPSIAAALLDAGPDDLLNDPETFGFLFESLCVRDLRVYASAMDAMVSHYRDKTGLEADAIIHNNKGQWTAFEMKLGASWIEAGAKTLNKLRDKVEKPPQFMAILIPDGYAYKREDGIYVIPISCLCP